MVFARRNSGTPDEVFMADESLMRAHVSGYQHMAAEDRRLLVDTAAHFARSWRWEASRNYQITTQMSTVISANAARMVIGFDDPEDSYPNVRTVVVHPSTLRRTGPRRHSIDGLMTDEPDHLAGEAHHHRGPVVLSWGAVRRETRHHGTGSNVVVHEFAHKLDMGDGVVNGSPPIADSELRDRWARVCTGEFEALRNGTAPHVLRDYAATDPGEFFAVAAEAFFDIPAQLAEHHRHLYGVLRDYFRQDPAALTR
jgi:hypothetical protein